VCVWVCVCAFDCSFVFVSSPVLTKTKSRKQCLAHQNISTLACKLFNKYVFISMVSDWNVD
jgi:hypothetical protein